MLQLYTHCILYSPVPVGIYYNTPPLVRRHGKLFPHGFNGQSNNKRDHIKAVTYVKTQPPPLDGVLVSRGLGGGRRAAAIHGSKRKHRHSRHPDSGWRANMQLHRRPRMSSPSRNTVATQVFVR